MTQVTPATAVLGPGKTGLAIGLRVLNLDGTTYAAFATTDVAETAVLGTYRKAGGVVCPDTGGYIVWGTALVDYAEATVESTAANVTLWAGDPVNDAIDGYVPVDPHDISDALLIAPVGVAADGSAMAELAAILEDTGTTLPGLISAGGGTGLYSETITVLDGDGLPVDGVLVQVATDSGFSNIIRSGYTNGLGQVTFNYDAAGTYYGRAEVAGYGLATFTVEVTA